MLKVLIAVAALAGSFSANAYEYTSNYDRVYIECHGYLNKFSIYLESSMIPGRPDTAITNLELGVVVKTWQRQRFEWEAEQEANTTAGSIALEGNVGGGLDVFKLSIPEAVLMADQQGKEFYSGLTLKGSLVKGNTSLACKASLRKIKRDVTAKY
jgi:hypothetical protein